MIKQMRKTHICLLACLFVLIPLMSSDGAQQYQGLCASIKMEIAQELAMERTGFLATLKITNNETDASITDFSARLTFENPELSDGVNINDSSGLFFVQPPEVVGITAVDGTGIIHPGQTAIVTWFIIPEISAGGTTPVGIDYLIGAELGGSIYGNRIAPEILEVISDNITVGPEPQLNITYFQPRDVDGDDPFTTDIAETPVPFTLGVLVKNTGYGRANSVRIASQQPRITENILSTLVIPQLIGARIDDTPTDTSLTLYMGDIETGGCRKGAWDMISSVSGEFVEFKASYTHASELGGRATSLIETLNAYFIVHETINDQPGRDDLLDFLADTVDDPEMMPDSLYESDCVVTPVNVLTNVEVLQYSNMVATVRATADFENWVYMRLDDPAQAKYKIASVVRSDGKVLNMSNYWTSIRYRETDNEKLTYLNIFDFVALGEYQYVVTYESPGSDTDPPVTTLLLSGQYQENAGIYYVLPETQLLFIAEDDSPVSTYYKLDAAPDFQPAIPFNIPDAGEHTVEFYSVDFESNEEVHQFATVEVSVDDPGIENVTTDTGQLFIAGDTISVRPTSMTIGFNGIVTANRLDAEVEVFQGAFGYPTLIGVPSSPTISGNATITVDGENVDYYRYRMDAGAWSGEFAVTQQIELTGLNGDVHLFVSGRSQYGDYHPDSDSVEALWTVDSGAFPISIVAVPETPSRVNNASLNIVGSDYYCYRVDGSFYQPDSGPGSPVVLAQLSDGEHTVEVLARADESDACPADGAGTMARWTVDRMYGLDLPVETRVRQESLGQVDGNSTEFIWDGRDDGGVMVSPGWYSVRITLQDGLGRSTAAVKLVYVGEMVADGSLLSDAGREADAFGRWAVWQDQRNGNWDIYTTDLTNDTATPVQVTSNNLNQEHPRTDGTYAVWEDRQADGTWDIWAKKLGTAEAAFMITDTPDADEKKPVIYWPWVVYQTKPVTDPNAPWQLKTYNMITDISVTVDATTQDQIDPCVYKQNVVWQDFRDVGPGEIYLKNLGTGDIQRITNDSGAQFYPVVYEQWIVWADSRNTQLDLYGYNLLSDAELQLTNTTEDETLPKINGKWVVYSEDSAGGLNTNLRILSLSNLASIQLTNIESEKEKPGMASGKVIWTDSRNGLRQIMIGSIPDLHPVFNNQNTVAVTEGMVTNQQDAYTLLKLWNAEAGITKITRYTSLVPTVVSETVIWSGGQPTGNNFALEAGSFIWVKFNQVQILDLGEGICNPIDLVSGINVFNYTCFPDQYTAYKLVREVGEDKINGLRMLDSDTGRWVVVSVVNNKIVGENFSIPRIAVVMMDMKTSISSWKPGE